VDAVAVMLRAALGTLLLALEMEELVGAALVATIASNNGRSRFRRIVRKGDVPLKRRYVVGVGE